MEFKSMLAAFAFLICSLLSCGRGGEQGKHKEPVRLEEAPLDQAYEKAMEISDGAHNSRNALDWIGMYRGMLPCADCDGIETTVSLHSNGEYVRTTKYLGKGEQVFREEGLFHWNESGSSVILELDERSPQMYKVGENVLFHLDREGKRITGDLADRYQLRKIKLESHAPHNDGKP